MTARDAATTEDAMKIGHVIDEGEAIGIRDGLRAVSKFLRESYAISDHEQFVWDELVTFALEQCEAFLDARVMCVTQQVEIADLQTKIKAYRDVD